MENMLKSLVEGIKNNGHKSSTENGKKMKGRVVLMKKNVLELNDFTAAVVDGIDEFLGKKVSIQLISSSSHRSSGKVLTGRMGNPAFLENWISKGIDNLKAGESAFDVTFDWDEEIGIPGAIIVKNLHQNEFYLKTLTLEGVPGGHDHIHFVCNSWVYPAEKYETDRIFFSNQAYLPKETPAALQWYREQELASLRGNGSGERKEWDRIYDYDYYNDLGDPEKGSDYARPVLGGSVEYPYPRRGRTGRPPTKTDPKTESRLPLLLSLNIYVPRDERFGHLKMSDFLAYGLKSISQLILPEIQAQFDSTPNEFDSFEDMMKIYEGGIKLPQQITDNISSDFLKALLPTDGERLFKYPKPMVIKEDRSAWRTDEEFAREMLAGVNPVIISGLQEFPPTSKLDPKVYGNQTSTISRVHIEGNLDGLTVEEAIKSNRLFILNHHDTIMPYLRRINARTTKTYASRTLLFLQNDGTLMPLAIELSLPHPHGDQFGPISKVYTPSEHGVESSIWQLAKAYVAVNDSGIHQLITHCPEYEELKTNPDKVFLKTVTAQLQTLLGLSIIEVLSTHTSDEVYLGQRENPEWTKDSQPLEAFKRFGETLAGIEEEIVEMNADEKWRNRVGPVKVPYTLLFPSSEVGITGKGIPNSISI
ncbi:OLC1v1000443C1 [Oldenlandia corymbosa var. corymbosa]|uniref:OLC1v1000443C1 n=1 Tax=Oldenlandia corymbosa var. corymbosa TaxID=529605 RepID=A0AAV1D3W4_OLDCO|nr:OLC1v1000443C1 [Oldenlandia corymbosa var. corymbosa]